MITVLFQTESHYPVDRVKIKEAVTNVLTTKTKRSTEVSITIVGDRRMKQLNSSYRGLDYATDVLSFSLNESSQQGTPFVDPPDHILRLGDIVVSYPQAVCEAAEKNVLVDQMIVELVLHGLNHLLGIHHPE